MVERDKDNLSGDKPHRSDHATPEVRHQTHNVGKGHFDSGRREAHDFERGQDADDNTDTHMANPGRGHDNQGRK